MTERAVPAAPEDRATPLVRFAVQRRVTMGMIVLGVLVLGWISLDRLPLEYLPEILRQEVPDAVDAVAHVDGG